jgi:phenylalanyl-tRNA synthetase beta chain
MREEMLFNGLEAIAYNQNRKQSNIRFYEFGKTYFSYEKGFSENAHLAMWLSGERYDENWQQLNRKYDVFYLKSIIDNLFSLCMIDKQTFKLEETENPLYSQALKYSTNKKELATIGVVNKSIVKKFEIESTVFYADVNWENIRPLLKTSSEKVKEVSRFPEVKRDLSMLLDKKVKYAEVEKIAFDTEQRILKEVRLFDIYEGEKIDQQKKSYAMSFILLDEQKTLEEKQIENIMQKLMSNFEQKLGAVIRKQ